MTDVDTKAYDELLKKKPSNIEGSQAGINMAKRRYISTLGEAAENDGFPLETICAKITKDLKGFASADMVRSELPSKYKNQVMQQRSQMQKKKAAGPEKEVRETQIVDLPGVIDPVQTSEPKVRPTADILRGAIRSKPPTEVVMEKQLLDDAVMEETKREMEEERQRIYELHADIPKPTEAEGEEPVRNNNNTNHQEIVLRAGKLCEDAARILLRSRPYNEIYFRLRRGTNVVDMIESDADRQQNKMKWMGVRKL